MRVVVPAKANLADPRIATAMSTATPTAMLTEVALAGAHRVPVNPTPCRRHWDFRPRRKVAVDRVAGRAMRGAAMDKQRRAVPGRPIAMVPVRRKNADHAAEQMMGDPGD